VSGEEDDFETGLEWRLGGKSHLFILSSTSPMSEDEEEWRNLLDELLRPCWASLHMRSEEGTTINWGVKPLMRCSFPFIRCVL